MVLFSKFLNETSAKLDCMVGINSLVGIANISTVSIEVDSSVFVAYLKKKIL